MEKKIVTLISTFLLITTLTFAQANNTSIPVNMNAEHDRMIALLQKSDKVVLPENVTTTLKDYAKLKGLNEQSALRNAILLKPIFDTNLLLADRLFACEIVKRACENPYSSIPKSIIIDMIKELTTK